MYDMIVLHIYIFFNIPKHLFYHIYKLPVSPQKFKCEGVECKLIIHVMIQRQQDEVKHGFSLATQTGQKSIISIINNNTHQLISILH